MDNRFYLSYVRLHHQASRDFRVGRTLMWIAAATAGGALGIFHWWGSLERPWSWTAGAFFGAWGMIRLADYWRKVSNNAAFEARADKAVIEFLTSDEAHKSAQEW